MNRNFVNEREGQMEFFGSYLPLVDRSLSLEDVLSDYTDGVINGNLLEFKLVINDLNSVLFQAVKYLSARRIKGKELPANILLISLTQQKAYRFSSEKYLPQIEKVYSAGASLHNAGFSAGPAEEELNFGDSQSDEARLIALLRTKQYTKIHLDENCIVAWAERYYRENPAAKKVDFIGDRTGKVHILGEIRQPDKLKNFIFPYEGETNAAFQYLMDKLNDTLQQKNLGAFYTPVQYARKSLDLLRQAIARVPQGNDYIILDRCAGTGNLEKGLTEEELSHCVLSTVEYFEYKVLLEVLGDKVRHIVPPTEKEDTFNMGLVRGADALSQEYVENEVIQSYVNNPNCTIILFENPPYSETTSMEHQRAGKSKEFNAWKKSWLVEQMRKEVRGTALNDLGNVFIWSAFKFYLRQPTDSYIVYSPVKYWKAQHLIDREFLGGYAFNRRHFHTTTNAMIMCALWGQACAEVEEVTLQAFDINKEGCLVQEPDVTVRRIHERYSDLYYDKRRFNDDESNGILMGLDGLEPSHGQKCRLQPRWNANMLGYLVAHRCGFDNPDAGSSLLVAGRYDGNGFFLRQDNFLEKLPMFAASRYIAYNRHWTARGNVMKSADGANRYLQNLEEAEVQHKLLQTLLFTTLEKQNHQRSQFGTDGRFYRAELTLDTTNGSTFASRALANLELSEEEKQLKQQWDLILDEAKKTANYDSLLTYSIFQIDKELNTTSKDSTGKTIYNYPILNGHLKSLKVKLNEYYLNQIAPFLFEYEFLK